MSLDPIKKQSPVGMAYNATVNTGCLCHHSHTNCEFSWNHAKMCPITNSPKPAITLEVGNYKLLAGFFVKRGVAILIDHRLFKLFINISNFFMEVVDKNPLVL